MIDCTVYNNCDCSLNCDNLQQKQEKQQQQHQLTNSINTTDINDKMITSSLNSSGYWEDYDSIMDSEYDNADKLRAGELFWKNKYLALSKQQHQQQQQTSVLHYSKSDPIKETDCIQLLDKEDTTKSMISLNTMLDTPKRNTVSGIDHSTPFCNKSLMLVEYNVVNSSDDDDDDESELKYTHKRKPMTKFEAALKKAEQNERKCWAFWENQKQTHKKLDSPFRIPETLVPHKHHPTNNTNNDVSRNEQTDLYQLDNAFNNNNNKTNPDLIRESVEQQYTKSQQNKSESIGSHSSSSIIDTKDLCGEVESWLQNRPAWLYETPVTCSSEFQICFLSKFGQEFASSPSSSSVASSIGVVDMTNQDQCAMPNGFNTVVDLSSHNSSIHSDDEQQLNTTNTEHQSKHQYPTDTTDPKYKLSDPIPTNDTTTVILTSRSAGLNGDGATDNDDDDEDEVSRERDYVTVIEQEKHRIITQKHSLNQTSIVHAKYAGSNSCDYTCGGSDLSSGEGSSASLLQNYKSSTNMRRFLNELSSIYSNLLRQCKQDCFTEQSQTLLSRLIAEHNKNQMATEIALTQLPKMISMQCEVERPKSSILPANKMRILNLNVNHKFRFDQRVLNKMSAIKLQIVLSEFYERIEELNRNLMFGLMERDELYLEQNGKLITLEDIKSWIKELAVRCTMPYVRRQLFLTSPVNQQPDLHTSQIVVDATGCIQYSKPNFKSKNWLLNVFRRK